MARSPLPLDPHPHISSRLAALAKRRDQAEMLVAYPLSSPVCNTSSSLDFNLSSMGNSDVTALNNEPILEYTSQHNVNTIPSPISMSQVCAPESSMMHDSRHYPNYHEDKEGMTPKVKEELPKTRQLLSIQNVQQSRARRSPEATDILTSEKLECLSNEQPNAKTNLTEVPTSPVHETIDEYLKRLPAALAAQEKEVEELEARIVKFTPEDIVEPLPFAPQVTLPITSVTHAAEINDHENLIAPLELSKTFGLSNNLVAHLTEWGAGRVLVETDLNGKKALQAADDVSLETLRAQINTAGSPSPRLKEAKSPVAQRDTLQPLLTLPDHSHSKQLEPVQQHTMGISPEILPFVIALMLEQAGVEWEEIQAWTKYLFGNGVNGHVFQREQDTLVKRTFAEMEELQERVLEEEAIYRSIDQQANLRNRIIVTNIATGADEEELALAFQDFNWDFRTITILNERHHSGTQSAYVDFHTREAAKFASYTFGDVYGLYIKTRLAEPDASDEDTS